MMGGNEMVSGLHQCRKQDRAKFWRAVILENGHCCLLPAPPVNAGRKIALRAWAARGADNGRGYGCHVKHYLYV
jgi:hypothetical protein